MIYKSTTGKSLLSLKINCCCSLLIICSKINIFCRFYNLWTMISVISQQQWIWRQHQPPRWQQLLHQVAVILPLKELVILVILEMPIPFHHQEIIQPHHRYFLRNQSNQFLNHLHRICQCFDHHLVCHRWWAAVDRSYQTHEWWCIIHLGLFFFFFDFWHCFFLTIVYTYILFTFFFSGLWLCHLVCYHRQWAVLSYHLLDVGWP